MARAEESRGLRDEANVGPDPQRDRELRRMSDLGDWQVADGEPDIRDWPVYASTGRELGVIDDLLVDTEAGEVVMLDVDLKRNDRHALAPLRAAWIDRGSKRVVLDARAVERVQGTADARVAADATDVDDDALPALPRHGALSDDDVRRFNDDYVRAYGGRGVDRDREYRLRRGDEEIRFGLQPRADVPHDTGARDAGPRRLLTPEERPHGDPLRTVAGGATPADVPHFAESERINESLDGLDAERRARATSADAGARADELADLPEPEGIEPRELDARVRIDEGGIVDERTPVGSVRYDTPNYPRHDYELSPEYDSSRVVRRAPADERTAERAAEPPTADAGERRGADRRVRYRTYPDDVGRPGEERR